MKTLINLLLATTISLMGVMEVNAQKWGHNKVKGNGNSITKTINTQPYDQISVTGSMDVVLQSGAEGSIQVTTDSNLFEYIIVETKGNELIIKIENNVSLRTKNTIKVVVPYEDISEVSLTGSGSVISKNEIRSDAFTTSLTGSGSINLEVNSTSIDAKMTGSGEITMIGSVKDLEIKVTGSGTFNGEALKAENTQAYVSGSGGANVNAKNSLKARVNGSGDIEYTGSPAQNDTKVLGSGSITPNR